MKKQTSTFTTELTRQLRRAPKDSALVINNHNGCIYASNGYFAVILTADEYDKFVRPITMRDPGNYKMQHGDIIEGADNVLDILGVIKSALDKGRGKFGILDRCPLTAAETKGRSLAFYHNASDGEIHVFNQAYTSVFSDDCFLSIADPFTPAIVRHLDPGDSVDNARIVGIVLPVRHKPNTAAVRAARAYYNDAPAADKKDVADNTAELRAELEKANARAKAAEQQAALDRKASSDKIAELEKALESLRGALATASTTATSPRPAAATSAPHNAQAIADKLAALPGVTATIKGAQTSVPIVWLSGNVNANRAAIEKAGGKWSTKRAAYYVRCA